MTDKFVEYYSTPEKIKELSEYVHQNFKLISTKMISEMRRKLDIEPEMNNKEGYLSLMASLEGRMFNEMIYSMCGICQSLNMKIYEIVPPLTLMMLLDLMKGENPLKGSLRNDVKNDVTSFKEYYLKEIDALRTIIEALPKD